MTERTVERFDPNEENNHFDDGNGRVCDGIKTIIGCNAGANGATEAQ